MKTCPRIVTADVDLNAALVGLPAILSPSEGMERPVLVPAGRDVTLSYRNPSDADAYILAHYLMLWHVDDGALTWLHPDPATLGGLGVDVRISFGESAGRSMSDTESHWSTMASHRGRPHRWPEPQWIEPRAVLSCRVRNYSNVDVAISLHPIALRQTSGQLGRQVRDSIDVEELKAERRRINAPLTPWPSENVRHAGVPALLFSPDGPVTLAPGDFATPGAAIEQRITTEDAYWLFVDRLLAAMREHDADQINELLTLPVFARLRDSRTNLHITEGWVPLGCLAGTAEDPALLPVEWATPSNGTLVWSLRSMHAAEVIAAVGVGGYYRTEE